MSVDERARHDLHQQLEANLGASAADTLMGLLPPVGWADVATKSDIALLDARFDGVNYRFDSIEHRFEAIDHRFDAIDHRFEGLESRFEGLESRFEGLESRFEGSLQAGLAGLRTEMAAQTRTLMFALIGVAVSFGGLGLAAAQLG